ncbi:MAG: SAM-dependent methyltransferase [Cyanobacteria bacterium QS_8_64_29]|nr:MAG: SAM-dependent methyltransferase [Cyanobacteria bacterium QS_8_64_29]
MSESADAVVDTARQYYNSNDADNFYYTIWGGEDIHVGLYQSQNEPIADASHRTVERMAEMLQILGPNSRVIDVGAGYGGSVRYLARTYGCPCVALNLSEVENERDRVKNREQGLDHLIDVVDGDFTDLPYADGSFDIVWSQDSFLHSGDHARVLAEVTRVLRSGGEFIFTDPMQTDNCPEGVLQPILERIHLDSLGSPGFYREQARKLGLEELAFDERTHQLTNHYGRVRQELMRREQEVRQAGVSQAYIDRMKEGLRHWVNGGQSGYMAWGIFHFRKQ